MGEAYVPIGVPARYLTFVRDASRFVLRCVFRFVFIVFMHQVYGGDADYLGVRVPSLAVVSPPVA